MQALLYAKKQAYWLYEQKELQQNALRLLERMSC
jgi:hypothetical protein